MDHELVRCSRSPWPTSGHGGGGGGGGCSIQSRSATPCVSRRGSSVGPLDRAASEFSPVQGRGRTPRPPTGSTPPCSRRTRCCRVAAAAGARVFGGHAENPTPNANEHADSRLMRSYLVLVFRAVSGCMGAVACAGGLRVLRATRSHRTDPYCCAYVEHVHATWTPVAAR